MANLDASAHSMGLATKPEILPANIFPVTIHFAQQYMIPHVIRHGEIPPNVRGTFDLFPNPFHSFPGDLGNHSISRPHHFHGRVQFCTDRG